MTLYFVTPDDAQMIKIDDEALIPEVHIEFECSLVSGSPCGVVAVVKDRHPVTLVDLTIARRKMLVSSDWWNLPGSCASLGTPGVRDGSRTRQSDETCQGRHFRYVSATLEN